MKFVKFFVIAFAISVVIVTVAPTQAVEVDLAEELGEGITSPETAVEDESIAGYIVRIYWFAVGAAGIVAVAVIVGGAIYYMTSSGSPDKQNDAKSYITSALWGVALLLGSYLILNTVNPQITALAPPGGNLPDCPEPLGGSKPGVDCLPKVPTVLPACTGKDIKLLDGKTVKEEPGKNCLPVCSGGQRACGKGEEAGDTKLGSTACTECAPTVRTCPQAALPPSCPAKIERISGARPNTGPQILKALEPDLFVSDFPQDKLKVFIGGIPDCDSCASGLPGQPGFEFGTKWVGENDFDDGTVWQYGAYPEKKGPEFGACIIYSYAETAEDAQNKRFINSDTDGLLSC